VNFERTNAVIEPEESVREPAPFGTSLARLSDTFTKALLESLSLFVGHVHARSR